MIEDLHATDIRQTATDIRQTHNTASQSMWLELYVCMILVVLHNSWEGYVRRLNE